MRGLLERAPELLGVAVQFQPGVDPPCETSTSGAGRWSSREQKRSSPDYPSPPWSRAWAWIPASNLND